MPEGAVYVGRPTKWGNPFRVGPVQEFGEVATREEAVTLFRNWWFYPAKWALPDPPFDALHEVRGLDLACWCPVDAACHADVLLELANRTESQEPWLDGSGSNCAECNGRRFPCPTRQLLLRAAVSLPIETPTGEE